MKSSPKIKGKGNRCPKIAPFSKKSAKILENLLQIPIFIRL
jgi:hypothetical protein